VADATGAEIPAEIVPQEEHADSSSVNCGSDGEHESDVGLQGDEDVVVDVVEASRIYCFGPSTVMVSRIREMSSLSYFAEGDACAPREETVPKPVDDEVIVFKEVFVVGLWLPPHSTLTEILLKFWV
jgi:hypothetical protein